MRPCHGPRGVPAPVMGPWRSARSGKWRPGPPPEAAQPARVAAEAVARESYGKLVAFLAARTRDVAGAEDALSDAFSAALLDWPQRGVPESPEAWLMAVARNK